MKEPSISPRKYKVLYVSSISFKVLGINDKLSDGIIANFWGTNDFSNNLDKSDGLVKIINIENINEPAVIRKTSSTDLIGPPKNNVMKKVKISNGKIPFKRFKQLLIFLVATISINVKIKSKIKSFTVLISDSG